jgi:hypothetical protein
MITISSRMSLSQPIQTRIIAARLSLLVAICLSALLLGGCTAVRLVYGQGPNLIYWWLDAQVDFNADQASMTHRAIDDWFVWHRTTQLPDYQTLLADMQTSAPGNLSPDQVCQWGEDLRARAALGWQRAVPALAVIAQGLRPAQIDHLEQRYRHADDDYRSNYLQADPADRAQTLIDKATGPIETLYGRLAKPQRQAVASALAASPFDPRLGLAERQARQRDRVVTLRRLAAEGADVAAFREAFTTIGEHLLHSPRPAHRAYQAKLDAYNCRAFAQWHNAMSPTQRQHAVQRLQGWQDDLRVLGSRAD